MSNRVTTGAFGEDWGRWLPLVSALIGLGVLPKNLKAPVAIVAVIWWLGHH